MLPNRSTCPTSPVARAWFALLVSATLLSGCAHTPPAIPGAQSPRQLTTVIEKRISAEYLLFLPRGYGDDPDRKWPVIVFLHGSGERGRDLSLLRKQGIPSFLDARPEFPFVVVSPQCPPNEYYDTDTVIAVLDEVERTCAVDPERVYLTGISMGGFGAWQLACAHPDRFAAVAPIAGWGIEGLAPNARHVPIWAFHGADDRLVPADWAQRMKDEMDRAGGSMRLTIYPKTGHNAWTRTYEKADLFEWFLSHKLDPAARQARAAAERSAATSAK